MVIVAGGSGVNVGAVFVTVTVNVYSLAGFFASFNETIQFFAPKLVKSVSGGLITRDFVA